MKKHLYAFFAVTLLLFSYVTTARATNVTFTPGEPYSTPTPPMDTALALEWLASPGLPYCYTGDVSDNTQTSYNNTDFSGEDGPDCPGRIKPTWSVVQAANKTAHDQLNVFSGMRNAYQWSFDIPALQTAVDGIPETFDDLTDGTTNKAFTAAMKTKVDNLSGTNTGDQDLSGLVPKTYTVNGHALSGNVSVTASDLASGVLADARVQQSNVTQHQAALSIASSQVTGTKTNSFISDFGTASRAAAQSYEGTTQRLGTFMVVKSATVSSGTAVFHLTADGTSGGTALCPNAPIKDSVMVIVNDAAASYQMGWVWTNSDKTLTVTTNYFTTANILSGLLGQAAANGKDVKLTVLCK